MAPMLQAWCSLSDSTCVALKALPCREAVFFFGGFLSWGSGFTPNMRFGQHCPWSIWEMGGSISFPQEPID